MKLYKLTKRDGTTYSGCQWGKNVTHETDGKGDLCGPGFTHWYTHPLLAVLLNPIHANFDDPILWEGEGEVAKNAYGLKVGCTKATTIRRIRLPVVTTKQKTKFGIFCALEDGEPNLGRWIDDWLSGKDRSRVAARAAARAAVGAKLIDFIALAEKAVKE